MRLTDEKIELMKDAILFPVFPFPMTAEKGYEKGMEAARDFYENQKCDNCTENKKGCLIKIYLMGGGLSEYEDVTEETVGCSRWESV